MAVIGTQTTKYETAAGQHIVKSTVFTYLYPVEAVLPGGSGSTQAVVTESQGTGGGISIYNRA